MPLVYVAGRGVPRAAAVMHRLSRVGYTVAFDWTADLLAGRDEDPARKASQEYRAIRAADALVLLREPGQYSALYEAGMAMGLNIPVVVVAARPEWFFALPHVTRVATDAEIVPALHDARPLDAWSADRGELR